MPDLHWGNHFVYNGESEFAVLDSGEIGPEPAAHGVTLFLEKLDQTAQGSPPMHALVTLFAGATSCQFLCDWRGQFSAVFQRIVVTGQTYFPWVMSPETVSPPGSGRFRVGAMVGFGGWHAARPLTLTLQQRVLGSYLSVPAFGRRFFPRVLRYLTPNWDILGLITGPLIPSALNDVELFIDSQYHCRLSERVVQEGVDVAGADRLFVRGSYDGAGIPRASPHILIPVFELGL
jgi:hypothetical protein